MNDFDDMFRDIRRGWDEQKEEFAKLLADSCCTVPQVGDRVVVACGLIGHGFPWVREECIVLETGSTSYKVRHKDEYDAWEEWVHQALIVEVLPVTKEVLSDEH